MEKIILIEVALGEMTRRSSHLGNTRARDAKDKILTTTSDQM